MTQNYIEILISDENYPKNLKEVSSPPKVLYIRGKILEKDSKAIAVVGSRNMTSYGKIVTQKLVKDLVKNKVTIVSGLARGIDTVAQSTAVALGGRTIAVMGTGIDRIYPYENIPLAKKIIENGALVSEYPPGAKITRQNFAVRNRIVTGLSKGVLIIEGTDKSGTLITTSFAANQNRDVFAVPGDITRLTSYVPLFLIKSGAKMVTSVEDILEEL